MKFEWTGRCASRFSGGTAALETRTAAVEWGEGGGEGQSGGAIQGISRSLRATSPAPRGSVDIEPAPTTSVQSSAADGEAATGLQLQTTPAEYPCRCVRCVGALSFLAGGGVRWVNRSRRSSESRILRQYLKTHRGLEDFSGAVKRWRTAATAERRAAATAAVAESGLPALVGGTLRCRTHGRRHGPGRPDQRAERQRRR